MQATNKMAVNLTQFNDAVSLFQQHYFLAGGSSNFGGQDIVVPFSDLNSAVSSFMQSTGAGADDVALRMVHCYDATNNELYLRIQLCRLSGNAPDYTLNGQDSVWYEVRNGSMNTTNEDSLSDATYFDKFYYCKSGQCSSSELVQLSTDMDHFVRNQVIPWGLEINLMYNQNSDVASISFAASTFTGNSSAAVDYPHCIVLSLLDGSNNRLVDDNTYQDPFTMKAADYSTLCPNCCNCYKTPA